MRITNYFKQTKHNSPRNSSTLRAGLSNYRLNKIKRFENKKLNSKSTSARRKKLAAERLKKIAKKQKLKDELTRKYHVPNNDYDYINDLDLQRGNGSKLMRTINKMTKEEIIEAYEAGRIPLWAIGALAEHSKEWFDKLNDYYEKKKGATGLRQRKEYD